MLRSRVPNVERQINILKSNPKKPLKGSLKSKCSSMLSEKSVISLLITTLLLSVIGNANEYRSGI